MDINATIIGQTIAMIFFVWFCMKYIWPVITDAIEARQIEIALAHGLEIVAHRHEVYGVCIHPESCEHKRAADVV